MWQFMWARGPHGSGPGSLQAKVKLPTDGALSARFMDVSSATFTQGLGSIYFLEMRRTDPWPAAEHQVRAAFRARGLPPVPTPGSQQAWSREDTVSLNHRAITCSQLDLPGWPSEKPPELARNTSQVYMTSESDPPFTESNRQDICRVPSIMVPPEVYLHLGNCGMHNYGGVIVLPLHHFSKATRANWVARKKHDQYRSSRRLWFRFGFYK